MNKGKLPDFYSFFNVEVYDDFSQKTLGSLLIKASSDKYHSRGMLIYLYQVTLSMLLLGRMMPIKKVSTMPIFKLKALGYVTSVTFGKERI